MNLSWIERPAGALFVEKPLPAGRLAAPRRPNFSAVARAWRRCRWRAPPRRRGRHREVRPWPIASTASDDESGTRLPDFAALPGTRRFPAHSGTYARPPRTPRRETDTTARFGRWQPNPP